MHNFNSFINKPNLSYSIINCLMLLHYTPDRANIYVFLLKFNAIILQFFSCTIVLFANSQNLHNLNFMYIVF